MIIDTSYLEPLYQAEHKTTYEELFNYLVELNFDEQFYKKLGIYYEEYTYKYGSFYVPIIIHFLLYYLYAKDYKHKSSYIKAYSILNRSISDSVRVFYYKEFKKCEEFTLCRKTYDEKYGEVKAQQIKEKLSYSMSNLDREILNKRNKSISRYASQRPESHNKKISLNRQKKIIDIKTRKIYNTAKEAVNDTGICLSYIRQCCLGKKKLSGDHYFYYFKDYQALTNDLI
jgi:hypothetical protein